MQWKAPVLDSLFNKTIGMKAFNPIKKRFQPRCDPVNIEEFSHL